MVDNSSNGSKNTGNSGGDPHGDPGNDVRDWLMVQSHGKTYLGRPTRAYSPAIGGNLGLADIPRIAVEGGNIASLTLDPVFEWVVTMIPTQAGPQIATTVRPCFSLLSVTRLRIVSYGCAVRVGDLAREEFKVVEGQIRETLEALGRAKAAQAGVLLAGPGTLGKLPPTGGRR